MGSNPILDWGRSKGRPWFISRLSVDGGMTLLNFFKDHFPDMPVIMIRASTHAVNLLKVFIAHNSYADFSLAETSRGTQTLSSCTERPQRIELLCGLVLLFCIHDTGDGHLDTPEILVVIAGNDIRMGQLICILHYLSHDNILSAAWITLFL